MRRLRGIAILLVVLAGGYVALGRDPARTGFAGSEGEVAAAAAFERRLSNVWIEVNAAVIRTLRDDDRGSRQQRFIVRLDGGQTLLVSHNIDVAPRVPLSEGDRVRLRGEYEWNEQGGVLHWTHADPRGRRPGGWIEWEGRRFE